MDNEAGLAGRLRCQKQVKRDSFMEVFAGDSDLPHSSRPRRCDEQERLEGGRLFLTTLKGGQKDINRGKDRTCDPRCIATTIVALLG
jgi:hypothetical protein